ncbi:MAG: molecular chaperone SurA [Legionellales bacterium]|nr:molecular chaperone SurA [Legionellales bacterium]
MKPIFNFMNCAILCLVAFLYLPANVLAAGTAKPVALDGVVAIVNSEVITQSELNQAMDMASKELKNSGTAPPNQKQFQLQVLNQLIDHKVEMQTAARMGITISEDQLNQAIGNIASKNHMTLNQLRDALGEQGINYAGYRKQIKEQMIIQQLLTRAVGGNIKVTDQDVKNLENSPYLASRKHSAYRVDDILISLPDNPNAQQVAQGYTKAQSLMEQIQKGANFKTLAAANSDGEEAMKGGDLGWRPLQSLPDIFAEKVVKMKPGEVAGPFRTGNGLHIIMLEAVQDNDMTHFITQTDVRHILIKTNLPSDDQPARDELLSIRKQILAGASFADMAKKYSQDTGSAEKGGDLGWVSPGMLVAPFEKAMDALAINQISEPVKSEYGWHLIQVLARRKVDDSKQYQKNQIKQMIYMRQFNENATIFVKQLRDESYIKILI